MTTAQTLKLVRGANTLDLSSGAYSIGEDFTIPAVAHEAYIAVGSSANITGGGELTGVKYVDRQWSFNIRITGSSDADVRVSARRVSDFLYSLSKTEPTYIEYRANSDTPIPLWGNYGAPLRFEVVDTVDVHLWDSYVITDTRARAALLNISVEIKPFAVGTQQLVCTATGGILEEVIGSTDGKSKGLIVSEATTNKMTNPAFSHATYGNGWSNGANVFDTKNTDPAFIFPGSTASVFFLSKGATNNTATQSIAAGNTNKHSLGAFVRLRDGSAVSATQCQLYYNAALTTTYQSLGNGWYWLKSENFDGIAGATATGILIKSGYEVCLAVTQLEEKAYCTYPCFGEMMGCAWSGTAHASTSTRTVASCKLPVSANTFTPNAFSVQIVWRAPRASSAYAANCQMIKEATTAARLAVIAATGQFSFNDGTNAANGVATAFAAGETLVMTVTCGPAGIALYRNGLADGTGNNSYAQATTATNWSIGSDATPALHPGGTYLDVIFFDRVLTATEVLNNYTNLSQAIADGRRPGTIPWFYTDDGDNILSLDTGKQPLGIAGGIPGSAPAVTEIRGDSSGQLDTINGILLSCFDTGFPLKLADLFIDSSGTVLAGDYGGQHKNATVTTSPTTIADATQPRAVAAKELNGKEAYIVARIKAASATAFYIRTPLTLSGTSILYSDNRLITPATSYRLFRTNKIVLSIYDNRYGDLSPYLLSWGGVTGTTTTGTLSVDGDWSTVAPRNVMIITTSPANGSSTKWAYQGMKAYDIGYTSNDWLGSPLPCTGDPIEFVPSRYNILQCYVGAEESVDPLTTYTVTLTSIKVTPRWALL